MSDWLLYGAYGFTGRLIAERAVAAGERPVLAGRDARKTAALAERLGLDHAAVGLEDPEGLRRALAGVRAVVHAAGPFVHTWRAMAEACIGTGTHYLDITGEIDVLEGLHALDGEARRAGIALLPAVGFDVVPTDCAAATAAASVRDPTHLEIAFHSTGGPSRGTARSAIEHLGRPALERRDGRIQPIRAADPAAKRRVPFSDRERVAVAISWGDVATAYHSTGIPNVRAYLAVGGRARRWHARAMRARPLLASRPARWVLRLAVDHVLRPPDAEELAHGRSRIRCVARNASSGEEAAVELLTPNGYTHTADAAVASVVRLLAVDGAAGAGGVGAAGQAAAAGPADAAGAADAGGAAGAAHAAGTADAGGAADSGGAAGAADAGRAADAEGAAGAAGIAGAAGPSRGTGFLTPSLAFGADFAEGLPRVERVI